MIIVNKDRRTTLGEAIEVAATAAQRVRGLLGRDCLIEGEGLLFKRCSSLHTFFLSFPIDIVFLDSNRKVLKAVAGVRPFRLVAAPLRAHYAIQLPEGSIRSSSTKVGDCLVFLEEGEAMDAAAEAFA